MPSAKYTTQEYPKHPFTQLSEEVITHLQTNDETGISPNQAQEAQKTYGPNKLEGEGGVKWHKVLLKQVSNAMILVCLAFGSFPCDDLDCSNDSMLTVNL